jgi:hypothetical protein
MLWNTLYLLFPGQRKMFKLQVITLSVHAVVGSETSVIDQHKISTKHHQHSGAFCGLPPLPNIIPIATHFCILMTK